MDSVTDITNFDKSLSELLALSTSIIKSHEKRNLQLSSKKNPILLRLEKYIKTYDKTEPEEHVWYFQRIFENNHAAILRGPGKDSWVKTGNITIQFGEDVGAVTDIKVHISIIYNTCCKLRDDIEESLQGLPDVDQSQELMFPTLFLLYLYKIFYEIAETSDEKERLSEYVSQLEKDAGIKTKSKSTGSNDPLGGLLGVATDFMGQMGIKLPEGQKLPSQEELSSLFGNMMNNPQTKSMMGNVMKEMKECNNIGDIVGKLMNNLGGLDPSIKQNLQNATQSLTNQEGENQNGDDGVQTIEDGDDFVEDN